MPTPAKAYSDLTGLLRQGPVTNGNLFVDYGVPPIQPMWTIHHWPSSPTGDTNTSPGIETKPRPVLVLLNRAEPIGQLYGEKIPAPPMGRQVVLTIPAIYMRKTNRPRKGQLWPRTR